MIWQPPASQINEPTEKPTISRPPESSHTPAKTSSEDCSQSPKKRGLDARAPVRCRRAKHVRRTTSIEDTPGPIRNVDLDCVNNPQPCLHYNSIINHKLMTDYRNNQCPTRNRILEGRRTCRRRQTGRNNTRRTGGGTRSHPSLVQRVVRLMSSRQQRSTTLAMDMPNYKARGPGTSTSRSSSASWTAIKTAG